MRESVKACCCVLVIAGVFATILSWFHDRPDQTAWSFRIGAPVVIVLSLLIFFRLHWRKDEAPDYLQAVVGECFFDRGGFCFGLMTSIQDGVCLLIVPFQNRYERRCAGRIAVRPGQGFWLTRAKIETFTLDIDCGPAAFGVASLAIPIPAKSQGVEQRFEVGASVEYPEGRGRMLRFRDGQVLRTNATFGNAFGTTLAIAGVLAGKVVLTKPATTTLRLPSSVAEEIRHEVRPVVKTLWRLGDPFLEPDVIRQASPTSPAPGR